MAAHSFVRRFSCIKIPIAFLRRICYTIEKEWGRRCAKNSADDIADLVEFLASGKARCITGQNYVIDNGRSLGLCGDKNRYD